MLRMFGQTDLLELFADHIDKSSKGSCGTGPSVSGCCKFCRSEIIFDWVWAQSLIFESTRIAIFRVNSKFSMMEHAPSKSFGQGNCQCAELSELSGLDPLRR